MATAKMLPSGSWRALVFIGTGPDKKRKYKSFTASTKKEAEYLAAEYMMAKTAKNEPLGITLGEAYDRYINSKDAVLSPATIREYKMTRKRSLQGLMELPLSGITQEKIQSEINAETRTHSWKTIRDMHGLLSAVLNAYYPDFKLHTTLPKRRKQEIYVPSDSEIKYLVASIKGDVLEAPVLLAAFASLRRSEICALDILDSQKNAIHVNKAMVQDENRSWVVKAPKTTSGDRWITIPQFVTEALLREQKEDDRFTELNPNQITKRFNSKLNALGIQHFRFHDLRHYNASIMLAMGVPDKYAQERGGWGSGAVMKRVYQHLVDRKKEEVENTLNSHFESLMQHEMQHENK